jgi:hypothetical protein
MSSIFVPNFSLATPASKPKPSPRVIAETQLLSDLLLDAFGPNSQEAAIHNEVRPLTSRLLFSLLGSPSPLLSPIYLRWLSSSAGVARLLDILPRLDDADPPRALCFIQRHQDLFEERPSPPRRRVFFFRDRSPQGGRREGSSRSLVSSLSLFPPLAPPSLFRS